MRSIQSAILPRDRSNERLDDHGGTALFYAMSSLFLCLFTFALWYCPRHL